jgi:hypothetical protein
VIARGKTLAGAYAIAGGKEGKERLDLSDAAMRATTLFCGRSSEMSHFPTSL